MLRVLHRAHLRSMPMESFETEGEAMGLYREAKEDPDDPPGAVAIARRILGRDAIRTAWVEGLVDGASLRREGGRWLIYVSRRLTFAELNFAVAHELGELALRARRLPRGRPRAHRQTRSEAR